MANNGENNQTECHHCFAFISRENKNDHEQNCNRNPQNLNRPNLIERPNWFLPVFFVMLALNVAMLAAILYSKLQHDGSTLFDGNIDRQIELKVTDKFENLINDKIHAIFTEKFEQNINEQIRTKNMEQFEQIKTQLTDPLEQKIYEEIQTNNNELSERIHKRIEKVYEKISATNFEQSLQINRSVSNQINQIKDLISLLEQKIYQEISAIKNFENISEIVNEMETLRRERNDLENEFKDQKRVSLDLQKQETVRITTLITDLKNDFSKLQIDFIKETSELERIFTDQNEKFKTEGDFYSYKFVEIQNGFDSQLRWQNYFVFSCSVGFILSVCCILFLRLK